VDRESQRRRKERMSEWRRLPLQRKVRTVAERVEGERVFRFLRELTM